MEKGALLTLKQYIRARESYCYNSPDCNFSVVQTGNLTNFGNYIGIFAKNIPAYYSNGINLRRFEVICQEVFGDCSIAMQCNMFTNNHLNNLKNISAAIVHWKMSSQGGRSSIKVENMLKQWRENTTKQLITAFRSQKMSLFRIGGVRIPTATAFMRFLFPNDFGVMDSRVVNNYTQPNDITTLSVRADGYINDTSANVKKFDLEYIPFLRKEVNWLNSRCATFQDVDAFGNFFKSSFRACDVEMALFQ